MDNYNFLIQKELGIGKRIVEKIGHKLWYFNLYNNKDLENTIIGNSKKV